MDVEFYRGKESGDHYPPYGWNNRYNDHGGTDRSKGSSGSHEHTNGHANGKQVKMVDNKSRDASTGKDSDSVASFDSTGKRKSFRRLITRFAEKTSMQGVPYINNAKFWWARLIWSVMLLAAVAAMTLHLWYLIDQYTSWPKQTKISLGFETLTFPEVTICNTNVMHNERFMKYEGAQELKELVEDITPENLVPDQFDPDYDPYKDPAPNNNQPSVPPDNNQPSVPADNNQPSVPPANNQPSVPADNNQPPGNGTQNEQDSQKAVPPKRRKRFVDEYKNFNTSKYEPDDHQNPREIDKDDDDFDGELDAQTAIDDLFTGLYMDINKHDRAKLGHNISDMLISCTFNGRECDEKQFSLHQTSEYGNCWSIRSEKFKVKSSGPTSGLRLMMFLEVDDYIKGITTGYGARVQVHEQNTYPFPSEEALFIPAAMETDIGLRLVSIGRLGGLYGDCDNGEAFLKEHGLKHSRRACQSVCHIRRVMEDCNCFDEQSEEFAQQLRHDIRPCRSRKEVECMVSKRKQILSCSCSNPCNEVQYLKSVSQRQWPTDEYAMVLLQGICNKDKDVCATLRGDIDDVHKISNNFLKLNVYYEDLNYENITEVPEIEIQQFLSDVGGAIGLWIGLSMLSLCELIQLFVELCDYGVHKSVKENRADRKRRRKERKRRALNNANLTENNKKQWPETNFRTEYISDHQNGYDRSNDYASPGNDVMNDRPYSSHYYSSARH